MIRACFAVILLTTLPDWAQAPKPFLQQSIEADSQALTGNYSPLAAGVAPRLELKKCTDVPCATTQTIPADFSVNFAKGLFTAHLDQPVPQKTVVYIELTANGDTQKSDTITVSDAPKPTVPVFLSSAPVYGAASVKVTFNPIAKPVGKPGFKLAVPDLFNFTAEVDPKDLAAGSADVKLPTLLLPTGSKDRLRITPTAGGTDGARKPVPIVAGSIRLDGPIKSGSKEITGTAYDGAQMVCLVVFGEAFAAEHEVDSAAAPSTTFRPRNCIEAVRAELTSKSRTVADLYPLHVLGTPLQFSTAVARNPCDLEEFRKKLPTRFSTLPLSKLTEMSETYAQAKARLDQTAGPVLASLEQPVDPKTHKFKFTLPAPVDENASLLVREIFPGAPGGSQVALNGGDLKVVDPAGLEYGQVRAFFTTGATLSQSDKALGSASPYLAVNFDGKVWGHFLNRKMPETRKMNRVSELYELSPFGMAIHWTGGVRLTQTGTVPPLGATPTALQSVQSGVFFAGLYVPIRIAGMDFKYRGVQYSHFVAPIAKVGVTAIDGGVARSRTASRTVTSLNPCPRPLTDCSAFNKPDSQDPRVTRVGGPAPFWGYGFRAGLMKYSLLGDHARNRQISADPIMYLDVTWGQNQAYVNPGTEVTTTTETRNAALNTLAKTTTTTQGFTFEPRLAVEGRMKIPYVPIEIGADVNMNWKHPIGGALPKDVNYTDFRFIIGFRVDASKTLFSLFGPKN
ncbi:MAG: hypothetical protein AAB225_13385 [Acidobacteriota bacterium]